MSGPAVIWDKIARLCLLSACLRAPNSKTKRCQILTVYSLLVVCFQHLICSKEVAVLPIEAQRSCHDAKCVK